MSYFIDLFPILLIDKESVIGSNLLSSLCMHQFMSDESHFCLRMSSSTDRNQRYKMSMPLYRIGRIMVCDDPRSDITRRTVS